jgi:thiol:disulfide interchange protein
MRQFAALVVFLVLVTTLRAEAPFVDESYDQAMKDAGKSGKLVMIDFFATWCAPCKVMDKNTWPDKNVQAFVAEHAIALRMDAEKETGVAGKYNVEAYPTIVFIKPDGSEAGRIVGLVEPEEFLKKAGEIVAKASGGAPKAP